MNIHQVGVVGITADYRTPGDRVSNREKEKEMALIRGSGMPSPYLIL